MSKELVERLQKYIADYIDAPTWGETTMYPEPPNFNDIKYIASHIAAQDARIDADAQTIATLRTDLAKAVEERDALAIELQILRLAIANHAAAQDPDTPF